MWTRDPGDGRTQVVTVSRWESLEVIPGFARADISWAAFYPADDNFLVGREKTVWHYTVA